LLLDTEIPAQTLVAHAQAQGATVFDLDPKSATAAAYNALTDELAESLGVGSISSKIHRLSCGPSVESEIFA
jgi:cellulose biosynthesis protein BcsQ